MSIEATSGVNSSINQTDTSLETSIAENTASNTVGSQAKLADMPKEIKDMSLSEKISFIFNPRKNQFSQSLTPSVNTETGKISVKTNDGYTLNFTGKQEEWFIASPDGKTTRIWGDPHVVESDGDKWDFYEDITFKFGNNKVTVQTVEKNEKVSYSGTVTIYGESDRITISGLDKNEPKIEAWRYDSQTHDTNLADGNIFNLTTEKDGTDEWIKK